MGTPNSTAVADSETDPFKHGRFPTPFIWGLYNGKHYYEFTNTDDFVVPCQETIPMICMRTMGAGSIGISYWTI